MRVGLGDGRGRAGAQADRPGGVSGQHRRIGQGSHAARRHGAALDAAGRHRLRLWHDRTRHREPAARRHPLPRRLEHQDDDRRVDRADGPGRQAALRRSDLEVCRWRSRPGTRSRSASCSRCAPASSTSPTRRSLPRASTTIPTRYGPRTRSSAWRSSGRPTSRRGQSTNTTTPTTTCSGSSPRRSTASRSRPSSRTGCSGRSA